MSGLPIKPPKILYGDELITHRGVVERLNYIIDPKLGADICVQAADYQINLITTNSRS